MNVFDLAATISLNSTAYDQGLDDARSKGRKAASAISKGLKTAMKVSSVAMASVGTAAVASGKKIFNLAQNTAAAGDEIDKTSQKLGLSAKSYQEWDYVLGQAGVEITSMGTGLKTMTNQIGQATAGSKKAREYFSKLGISMEDLSTMSREDIFSKVVEGFQGMEDSTERAALANKLFGRSGQELAPLFNTTSKATDELKKKAQELGFVMSDEAVKASADFNDSLDTLKRTATGVKNNFMGELLPSFTEIFEGFSLLISGSDGAEKKLGEGFSSIIDKITAAIPKVVSLLGTLTTTLLNEAPAIFQQLVRGITQLLPTLLPVVGKAVVMIGSALIKQLPTLLQSLITGTIELIKQLTQSLPQMIPQLIGVIMEIGKLLVDNAGELVSAAVDLVIALVEGLTSEESITKLVDGVVDIINSIVKLITEDKIVVKLIKAVIQVVTSLLKAVPTIITKLAEALPEIVTGLVEALTDPETLMMLATAGIQLIGALFQSMPEIISAAVGSLGSVIQAMIDGVGAFLGNFMEIGGQIIGWIGDGISNAWNSITSWFSGAVEGIKSAFRALPEWFGNIFSNAWNGIKNAFSKVGEFFAKIWEGIKAPFKTVADWFSGTFKKAWEGVKSVFETGGKIFTGIKDGIVTAFKVIVNGIIDGINKVVAVPFNGINTALDALRGLDLWGWKPFDWLGRIDVPQIPKLARGGVLGRGQVGLLEGNGAEAVVPLEKNKQWIHAVAEDMKQELQPVSITINNPVVREDEDIERIAEAVSNALGIDFNQRGVAYG